MLDEQHEIQAFFEFFTVLYLSPFALAGLVWLMYASDFGVVLQDPRGFVILFISLLIIQSRPAVVPLRLSANRWTHMTISLGSILLWVGLFIWGEIALVIDLLVILIIQFWAAWQHSRYAKNVGWMYLASILQSIANTTLAGLVGMVVFRAMGGVLPLDGLEFRDWIPAFAALIVSAILPAVIMLPVIVQINRLSKAPNTWASLGSFILSIMRVLLITTPFAIPFTLLYTQATPGVNWFATIGLVLVNLLLHYLSRTNQRSRQRTREMRNIQLTRREKQILEMLADDQSLHDIAGKLHLSYTTVRNHTQHILNKLGVHSIMEAVAFYLLTDDR